MSLSHVFLVKFENLGDEVDQNTFISRKKITGWIVLPLRNFLVQISFHGVKAAVERFCESLKQHCIWFI